MNLNYSIALTISAVISGALMIVALRRKSAPGASGLALTMAALFIWAFTYAIRWSVNTQQAEYFWLDMTYLGVVIAPSAMLIFALQYTDRGSLVTPRNLAILAIEPIVTLVFLWTDPFHGLFYAGQRNTGAILSGGIAFWFNIVYSYAVLLVAMGILIAYLRKLSGTSRAGIWTVLIGMSLPAVGPILGMLKISQFPGLDITPFIFSFSGLIFAYSLFHYRLLDLTPVAYNKLIETMMDGMVVLDEQQRIMAINPAAQVVFQTNSKILGTRSAVLFSPWPELLTAVESGIDSSLIIHMENGKVRTFEVAVTKLLDKNDAINGWLLVFHDITTFKQTEEALVNSENKLRSLFSSMSDVILILDKDGRYLEIAPTNPTNLARDPFNLIGKTVFDIFSNEQATKFIETIHQALETGQMVRIDYFMEVENQTVWFAGNISPLTKDTVTWVARDITERKIWEEEIRRSENKLRSLFSAMNDVILVFNHEGRYLEVAPTSTTGLYLVPSEIVGKTVSEILPAETAEIIKKAIQQSLASQSIIRVEYSLLILNKTRRFSATASPLSEDSVIFVAQDITDQYKSAQALKEKDTQYQDLVNNLNEGIGVVDLEETFIFANPTAANFFGVPQGTLVGRSVKEFVDRETFEFLKQQTQERIAGKSGKYDLKIIRPDGAHRIFQVSPRPQLDQDGVCIGAFVIFRDITEQKLAEQAIKESETRLKLAQQIAHIGNWEFDLTTRKIWASSETFNIFGLEEITPYITIQDFFNLLPKEDRRRMRKTINNIIHEQTTSNDEFQIIRGNDSEHRILHGVTNPVTDANGALVKISGVVQDITQQKQTEKALEKRMLALTRPLEGGETITFNDLFNMEEIQNMQDTFALATGVASVITLPDGTPITRASNNRPLCALIFGKTEKGRANCIKSNSSYGDFNPDAPVLQPCLSGGMWDARADISVGGHHIANWIIGQVREDSQSEELMRLYAREIGADEDEVIAAYHEVPIMSRERFEQIAQALFTLTNQLSTAAYQNVQQARFISERKKAEEALFQSENKLRSLFKAMTDVIIIYGKDGRYQEIGETSSGRLYKSPNYLINKTIQEVFPPETSDFFMSIIQKTLASQKMTRVDYQLPIDGITYWFSANVSPLNEDSVIWVARDITERKKVEDTLHYQSMHDSLTGLYNRQYYETEIVRLQHSRLFPISIMVMDVDGLKWVNDNRGHSAGDELLQRTAGILKSAFRPEDMVARMGGDEFVVVLPETDQLAALQAKTRLEEILKNHNQLFSSDMKLGISIGIDTGSSEMLLTEVFKQADQAMYQEKAAKKRANI